MSRSSNNCYLLYHFTICLNNKLDETYLWHRHLRHISSNSLNDTIRAKATRGLSKISLVNIFYNVGVCARYQTSPKESHFIAVKKINKYISETLYFRIWYSNDSSLHLEGYYEADWVGSCDDRKSTTSACFFLGKKASVLV